MANPGKQMSSSDQRIDKMKLQSITVYGRDHVETQMWDILPIVYELWASPWDVHILIKFK